MKIILEGSSKEIKEFMSTYKDLKDIEVKTVKNKKYELTEETIYVNGHALHRIKALKGFGDVKKGDLGGYVETEDNLSHEGNCWIYDSAKALGNANISGNAKVLNVARVFGNARIYDNAVISECAQVWGSAEVFGYARVFGHAKVNMVADISGHSTIHGSAIISRYEHIYDKNIDS